MPERKPNTVHRNGVSSNFSDGITGDIITALSRSRDLFVIDRASAFAYKGKSIGVEEVSRELRVKYVLEGGVQKAAGQLRVTAQLVDATTGAELWAERYERPQRDIFSVQDELVRRIVITMGLQLVLWDRTGLQRLRGTDDLEAYDCDFARVAVLLHAHERGSFESAGNVGEGYRTGPEVCRGMRRSRAHLLPRRNNVSIER
jgi:TolB-like protein